MSWFYVKVGTKNLIIAHMCGIIWFVKDTYREESKRQRFYVR